MMFVVLLACFDVMHAAVLLCVVHRCVPLALYLLQRFTKLLHDQLCGLLTLYDVSVFWLKLLPCALYYAALDEYLSAILMALGVMGVGTVWIEFRLNKHLPEAVGCTLVLLSTSVALQGYMLVYSASVDGGVFGLTAVFNLTFSWVVVVATAGVVYGAARYRKLFRMPVVTVPSRSPKGLERVKSFHNTKLTKAQWLQQIGSTGKSPEAASMTAPKLGSKKQRDRLVIWTP